MRAYFVTWNHFEAGIRNSHDTLLIGDTRNTFTRLNVASSLKRKNTLANIAIRSKSVRRSRNGRIGTRFTSTIIPNSGEDRCAVLLVSLLVGKDPQNIRWWSVQDPHKERSWMERNGMALNGVELWPCIFQYGYGIRHDDAGNAIVRRLLVIEGQNGFIAQDRTGLAFCVYWNGFTLDQTDRMRLHRLQQQVNRVLTR